MRVRDKKERVRKKGETMRIENLDIRLENRNWNFEHLLRTGVLLILAVLVDALALYLMRAPQLADISAIAGGATFLLGIPFFMAAFDTGVSENGLYSMWDVLSALGAAVVGITLGEIPTNEGNFAAGVFFAVVTIGASYIVTLKLGSFVSEGESVEDSISSKYLFGTTLIFLGMSGVAWLSFVNMGMNILTMLLTGLAFAAADLAGVGWVSLFPVQGALRHFTRMLAFVPAAAIYTFLVVNSTEELLVLNYLVGAFEVALATVFHQVNTGKKVKLWPVLVLVPLVWITGYLFHASF